MNDKRMKDALENLARRGVPENTNLWPELSANLERKSPMTTLRSRTLMAVLIALFVLLALSGVVYAIGKSLGYIPGYGIMDKNVQMLTLVEPVSQTRDGVVITIEELIVTPNKLYATIATENVLNSAMLQMSDLTTPRCINTAGYFLPDGTELVPDLNGPNGGTMDDPWSNNDDVTRTSYRGHGYFTFTTTLDLNQVHELTLHMACVMSDIAAGSMPENWEFHLRLVPASNDTLAKTAMPVIEYTPIMLPTLTPDARDVTPTAEMTSETNPISVVNPISVTKMVDTGDGYILIGQFIPPTGVTLSDRCCGVRTFDATGKEFLADMPMDIDPGLPTINTPGAFTWVRKISKEIALPIAIKVEDPHWNKVTVPFEFDAGENPQIGNEWQVNQPFDVNGISITLKTIRILTPQMPSASARYEFYFTFPSFDTMVSIKDIQIQGTQSVNSGFGGGGCSDCPAAEPGEGFSVEYNTLLRGKLQVVVIFEYMDGEQSWVLNWQP